MPCDSPLSIRYDPPRPDGKGGFVYWFPGDCGKCLPCLMKRKAQWSFRIQAQQRVSFSSYFVTLTYNDIFLPMGDDGSCGNKNDHKDFIKWLRYYESEVQMAKRREISYEELERKRNGRKEEGKLSYYGVLEYGDKNGRCHFHYILFNVRDINNINFAWSEILRDSEGNPMPGRSKGRVQVDECNANTIDYVLKYLVKDRSGENGDRQRECNWMSKGIGLSVVNKEFLDYIKTPAGNQVINSRGSKLALPRYYSKKFVTEDEREEKRKYIEEVTRKNEEKFDMDVRKTAVNPEVVRQSAKNARSQSLKNRRRREID